jgi:hypothetical protein
MQKPIFYLIAVFLIAFIFSNDAQAYIVPFQVNISANPTSLPVGSSSTITAIANVDIGTTPYYIRIYEGNIVIRSCYSGTSCSVTVTKSSSGTYYYYAKIEKYDGTEVKAVSNTVSVTWYIPLAEINISANPTSLPVGSSSTITAIASYDVGPTSFSIRIYEGNTVIRSCKTGTTCSVSITKSSPGTYYYVAKIETNETRILATSNTVSVTWTTNTTPTPWSIRLSANPTSLPVGSSSTITAIANVDIGTTPYYIRIYEGNIVIRSCYSGTSCSVTVTKSSSGTYYYYAKIEKYDGTEVKAVSNTVSVTWYIPLAEINISANPTSLPVGSSSTITAIASYDVGPTSFSIRIYEGNTVIRSCKTGTTCSVSITKSSPGTYYYVAKIETNETRILATSNTVSVTWTTNTTPTPWSIRLSANPTSLPVGSSSTITAIANVDIGTTPYYIRIYEGNIVIRSCYSGTSCSVTVTKSSSGTYYYYAKIEKYDGTEVKAVSNTVSVTWYIPLAEINISANPTSLPVGSSSTITAIASYDVGPTSFSIRIYEGNTVIRSCKTGTTCSVSITKSSPGTYYYVAKIETNETRILATSNTVSVTWTTNTTPTPWSIRLSANPTSLSTGETSVITATANQDVGPTIYYIRIYEGNTVIKSCSSGTTCSVSVIKSSPGTYNYYAKIEKYEGTDVQATSNTVSVTWSGVIITVTTTKTVTTTTLACGGLNQPCCSDIWGVWCNSPYVCQQGICKAPTTVTTTTSTTTRTTTVTTTTLPSGLSTTCSGRTTSQDIATISPTTNWQTISGSLSSSTDTKRYKITVTSPGQHEFSLCSADGGSANYDSYICIFDSSGNFITSNDDYCNRQSKITFSFSSTGTYYIQISGYSSNYGSYTLAYRKTPVTTTVTTTTLATTVTTTTLACGGLNQPCCSDIWGVWCNSPYVCQQGICKAPTTVTTTTSTTTRTTTVTTTTTTISTCDSSSYASCTSAYNFGTGSGSKSNMCGSYQYYKVSTPFDKTCDITWTITPDSNSDYDLYVKWSSACPSISDYDCSSLRTTGQTETCSKTSFSGTAYALVRKYSGSGSYTISVSVTNCR